MKWVTKISALTVIAASNVSAQWAVFDVANLTQNVTNYAAMVEQIAKQAEQIGNQVQQIRHMEDQLARMGRMSDFKSLVGFPQLQVSISLPTKIETWSQTSVRVDGTGLFGDSRDGIYREVSPEFRDFDGAAVARDPRPYKPAHDVTAKVDNFKQVQADVFARRKELRQAISQTSAALQAAETDAEGQKLSAILAAQYAEVAALDSEVVLNAAEIQVKKSEAEAMQQSEGQAQSEARTVLANREAAKVTTAFKPRYECLLQYVREKPFAL